MSEIRPGESLEDAARRVATDALYAARDRGGDMHRAGHDAAEAVLALLTVEHMTASDGRMSLPPSTTDRPPTRLHRLVGPWDSLPTPQSEVEAEVTRA